MPDSAQPVAENNDPQPGSAAGALTGTGVLSPQGLFWSWELDLETVQAVLSEPAPWNCPRPRDPGAGAAAGDGPEDAPADVAGASASPVPDDPGAAVLEDLDNPDAILADLIEATVAERTREVPAGMVAGRVAEALPPGPDLAGWLATTAPPVLDSGALPGVAASFRRLASWAQAGELAAIAQMVSRSAAADGRIGVDEQGRPARIPDEAAAQVSLALAMTRYGACWWTDLAVTLAWRLAATGAALAGGCIDLARAQLIAEATAGLADEKARAVEAKVLDGAGNQTLSQLRSRLRRAVIAADPDGAEQRRQESEHRARVLLYADDEGTATLAGQNLPGTRATAAMARISAMARALKASGATGGMDLLRAQVFVGLLLGTLPCIPPALGGPPGEEPPGSGDDDDSGAPDGSHPGSGSGGSHPGSDSGSGSDSGGSHPGGGSSGGGSSSGTGSAHDSGAAPGAASGRLPAGGLSGRDSPPSTGESGAPVPSDEHAPYDDTLGDPLGGDPAWSVAAHEGQVTDEDAGLVPSPLTSLSWSALPSLAQWPGAGPGPGSRMGRPPPGLLDLTMPWETLAGCSSEPGHLGRLGPVTPVQAREIADAAVGDPAVEWRVILTSRPGQAIAVTRVPPARAAVLRIAGGDARAGPGLASLSPASPSPASLSPGRELVGRVTLTVPDDVLVSPPQPRAMPGVFRNGTQRASILARSLRAAGRAATAAATRAAADAAATGGCAHTTANPGYRPASRLREYVVARDLTCRFPSCGQPAWRGDLDHTQPWDKGGRTCSCNLGGLCRHHHILKQQAGWQLIQVTPGAFLWTTSAGRTYGATADSHAA